MDFPDKSCVFILTMAIFKDLAVELQEAIWELVLPASRGVHWVEVEGIPHGPEFIRDSVRMTQWYRFDHIPETFDQVYDKRDLNPEFEARAIKTTEKSSPFFRHLLITAPTVFGQSGSDDDCEELHHDLSDEIAYTRRCRQLSTYYQISTFLSICWLSRSVAQRYIQNNYSKYSWPIYRSIGPPCRPRPMDVLEAQYSDDKSPATPQSGEPLPSRIHTLDLVVFRLHDRQGRATPLLRHAPWQNWIEQPQHGETYGCFDRIGLELHPSWTIEGGQSELRSGNVQAFVRGMHVSHFSALLYWLVDGVPRPDYPSVVEEIFAARMFHDRKETLRHLLHHWEPDRKDSIWQVEDHHLGQEFEANGRRYYIVFIVCRQYYEEEQEKLNKAGLGFSGPFPGSAAIWPEALRQPVRLAYDISKDGNSNLGTYQDFSYILSWEPIGRGREV
jgi:hypothetical protein